MRRLIPVLTTLLLPLLIIGCDTSESLIVNPGNCWIYSEVTDRLVAVDSDGDLNVIVDDPGSAFALATDPVTGDVWLADPEARRVVKYGTDGILALIISGFSEPMDLVVDPDSQYLYVIDMDVEELTAFEEDGDKLWSIDLGYPPHQLCLAGNENARRLVIEGREDLYAYDTAQGDLLWTHELVDESRYHLDAEPDADCFWLSDGQSLTRLNLDDASTAAEFTDLGRPTIISAAENGCWYYDDEGGDLYLLDDDGAVEAEVENLPGTPLLGAVSDRVWVAVESADLVALYEDDGELEVRTTSIIGPSVLGAVR